MISYINKDYLQVFKEIKKWKIKIQNRSGNVIVTKVKMRESLLLKHSPTQYAIVYQQNLYERNRPSLVPRTYMSSLIFTPPPGPQPVGVLEWASRTWGEVPV